VDEANRKREQEMLRRCAKTLRDYNIVSVDGENALLRAVDDMAR